MTFRYRGPATLHMGGHNYRLDRVALHAGENDEGTRHWKGVAVVPVLIPEAVGEVGRIILEDGRRGDVYTTAYPQGRIWVIEIHGCGPEPH